MNLSALQDLPLVSYPAGAIMITEGHPLDGIYFLVRGEVEILKCGLLIAETYEPGAVLGEMSWLLGTAPTATVRTLTPCEVRHAADPGRFLRENPDVVLHMAVTLARRVDSLARYLVEIKNQFRDQQNHLGIIDEVLSSLMHQQPRAIPRRATGD